VKSRHDRTSAEGREAGHQPATADLCPGTVIRADQPTRWHHHRRAAAAEVHWAEPLTTMPSQARPQSVVARSWSRRYRPRLWVVGRWLCLRRRSPSRRFVVTWLADRPRIGAALQLDAVGCAQSRPGSGAVNDRRASVPRRCLDVARLPRAALDCHWGRGLLGLRCGPGGGSSRVGARTTRGSTPSPGLDRSLAPRDDRTPLRFALGDQINGTVTTREGERAEGRRTRRGRSD
jgi:hypothetical protein